MKSLATSKPASERFKSVSLHSLELLERSLPKIQLNLKAALNMPVPLQPCIRDIWSDHVLFQGNQVSGIIDLAAAKSDVVAADLARLLGSMLGDDKQRWDVAIDEYQKHRSLNANEWALIQVFDQANVLLNSVTWIRRYYLEEQRTVDNARVLGRLEIGLQRMQAML